MRKIITGVLAIMLITYAGCSNKHSAIVINSDYEIYDYTEDGKIFTLYKGKYDYCVVVISKGDKKTSFAIESGNSEFLPLTFGDGEYKLEIYEINIGEKEIKREDIDLDIKIKDLRKPYLGSTYYVNYDNCTKELRKIEKNILKRGKTIEDYCYNVYKYVSEYLEYDYMTAEGVVNGNIVTYKTDIEDILDTRLGICLDYASLNAALLRINSIPARIVVGEYNGQYHAWVEAYINKEWKQFDSTNKLCYKDTDKGVYSIEKYF